MQTIITLLLLVLLPTWFSHVHGAVGSDVVPINWSRFQEPSKSDSMTTNLRKLMNNEIKFFLKQYVPVLKNDSSGLFAFNLYENLDHRGIREPSEGGAAMAVALGTGSYDSTITGVGSEEAKTILIQLIKSLLATNIHCGGTWWGYNWRLGVIWSDRGFQDAYWASFTAFAAWMIWQDLDTVERDHVAQMIEASANQFLSTDPPYCNDCTNDTKAEENAWNAMAMQTAIAMMPNHPNVIGWKQRCSQWMISSYARNSDLTRLSMVDGKFTKDWITGWNMREPGYVYNHGIMSGDYMVCIDMNLYSLFFQSLAGGMVPQAGIFNFDVVYHCLVDYHFNSPPFVSPGGTIYRPGRATVYFPDGTDWTAYAIIGYSELDAFASVLPGIPGLVSIPPDSWARIRIDTLLWRQGRFTTGQINTLTENGRVSFKLGEIINGWLTSASYLALWLKERNGLSPIGNWNSAIHDTLPPSAPSYLRASQITYSSIVLNWSHVSDNSSGIAYYTIYRDSIEVGRIQDTVYLDTRLPENTVYRYQVSATDSSGNKGPKSQAVSFTTLTNTTDSTIFTAVADAYVRDGSYAGTNYGYDLTLDTKTGEAGYSRWSYLKFDLSTFSDSDVVSATLRLTVSANDITSNMQVSAYAVSDTVWKENTITWNNKPALGALLSTITLGTEKTVAYEWDVTPAMISGSPMVGLLSICLKDAVGSGFNVIYSSRETANGYPVLVVRTKNSTRIESTQAHTRRGSSSLKCSPSPFNPALTIYLPESGLKSGIGILLQVFSADGQLVADLSAQALKASVIKWDATAFPSGVYIVRHVCAGYAWRQVVVLCK